LKLFERAFLTGGITLVALTFPAAARCETPADDMSELADQAAEVVSATNRIIVPIPIADPQLGTGLGLGVGWFYKPSGSTIPWTTGVGAMKTSNGSWGVFGFHNMALGGDRFRISAALGKANLNTKYYGSGSDVGSSEEYVELGQKADFAQVKATYQIVPDVYLGGRARYIDMALSIDLENILPEDFELPPELEPGILEEKARLLSYGPVFLFDSTGGAFSPRKGVLVSAQWLKTDSLLDDGLSFSKGDITANQYFGFGSKSVLALRQSLCFADEETPFYALCQYGSNSNIRGYVGGQHRDHASWSVQAEWRQQLTGKFGVVAFAGIGAVAGDIDGFGSAESLPAAGAGIRYLVAKDYGVNLRLDLAWGKGSKGVYVSIGEAF